MICVLGQKNMPFALDLAQSIRNQGIRVAVDLTQRKLGDQVKHADKRGIPKVICIGDEEEATGKFKVKTLSTGEESQADKNTRL